MNKPYPALCKDCKYSFRRERSLRCDHPKVNARDAWALGSETNEGLFVGKTCTEERAICGPAGWLAACGMKGKLWGVKE